ncbi:hypothetical protein [Leifsonia sp. 71-9]|uniref:hypothetical protein n=1 Tax=Leifsonia sp. 71-9 TaxID=1895934 RepID=UPI0025C4A063|nr:hypothetical protein [Leifsonia sp. 71-9]
MKVLAFVLSVLIATALVAAGTALIVIQSPSHSLGLDLVAIFALTVFIYGPLLLGSVTSYWDVRGSAGSRASFRRYLWVVLGIEALAAIAIVVYSVMAGTPIWFPIVFIVGGAVLTVAGLTIGRALHRHEQAHPRADESWRPVSRHEVSRKVLGIAVTFVAIFIVGLVVFGLLGASDGAPSLGDQLTFAFQFATIGAALTAILVSVPLNRRLRSTVGGDFGTIRTVGKVVLGNKEVELDHAGQVAAAKYATIIPTILGFQLSYLTLLYLGLGTQQVRMILGGRNEAFNIGFTILLIAILVAFIPYVVVRIRRARTYAREHGELLASDDSSWPASTP